MIKFTPEEISLCKQVAEKYIKPMKYGDWWNDGKKVTLLFSVENWIMSKSIIKEEMFPLWTISDCVEFFEERNYQVEIKRVSDSWLIEIWKIGHKAESTKEWTVELLEACLKAVLAVLVEKQ